MESLKYLLGKIWSLRADQIAIISLLVTLLLFVLGKIAENRIKIYDTRKIEYIKLLNLLQKIFSQVNTHTSKLKDDVEIKNLFLDVGASLAIFGSKKLYTAYCFYRRLANDEIVRKSKWYNDEMIIYALGEMYRIMRTEVGLNHDLIPVDVPDILAFVFTDFSKPDFKKKFFIYHYNKFFLNSAIFWGKIEEFLPLIWLSNYVVKPFFLILFCIIRFPIKLLIFTPIKQIRKVRTNKITKENETKTEM